MRLKTRVNPDMLTPIGMTYRRANRLTWIGYAIAFCGVGILAWAELAVHASWWWIPAYGAVIISAIGLVIFAFFGLCCEAVQANVYHGQEQKRRR